MSGPFMPEKKTQIVLEGLRSPDKIMEVCVEYGVHPVTYSHWKRAVLEVGAEAFRRGGKTYPDGLSRANRKLKEKTDRILLTDYAAGGKPRNETTVVVSKGTDVPEIVSLSEDRSGVSNPP